MTRKGSYFDKRWLLLQADFVVNPLFRSGYSGIEEIHKPTEHLAVRQYVEVTMITD